ncbi:MAG: hypothetical protein WCJ62_11980, partial [Flavobacterium sp.]
MHETEVEFLDATDFSDETNKIIFQAIRDQASDNIMLLHKHTKLPISEFIAIQGAFLTHDLMDYNISALKDHAIGQQIDLNLKNILQKDMTIEQKIEELQKLSELQTFGKRKASVMSLHDASEEAFKQNQETKKNKHKRLYFPYQRLNAMAGALMQGKLV